RPDDNPGNPERCQVIFRDPSPIPGHFIVEVRKCAVARAVPVDVMPPNDKAGSVTLPALRFG
ncbi:MAG: hypothetical protein WCJ66_04100, partial [Verrucomicrobiota bacterium]